MENTLYDVLGVAKDADKAEIKAAYKKRAKEVHPDAGGNSEKFEKVKNAFDILYDPEKRAYYDEHGEAPEDDRKSAIGIILGLFNEMLDADLPLSVNYVDLMKDTLQQTVEKIEQSLKKNEKDLKRFERLKKKFTSKKRRKKKESPEVLAIMLSSINQKVLKAKKEHEKSSKALKYCKEAIEILGDFDFEIDPPTEMDKSEIDDLFNSMFKGKMGNPFKDIKFTFRRPT